MQQLNLITKRVVFAAFAALGVLTAVSAYTIPGTTASSQTATTATSSSTDASSSDSYSSDSTSSGFQGSSIPVTSSSGSAMTVSGGSH
jgi:hypothetical protein